MRPKPRFFGRRTNATCPDFGTLSAPAEEPRHQRQRGTEQKAGHNRKIKPASAPLNTDISRKTPWMDSHPFRQDDHEARHNQQNTGVNQEPAHL
jgi:hypothetical protein